MLPTPAGVMELQHELADRVDGIEVDVSLDGRVHGDGVRFRRAPEAPLVDPGPVVDYHRGFAKYPSALVPVDRAAARIERCAEGQTIVDIRPQHCGEAVVGHAECKRLADRGQTDPREVEVEIAGGQVHVGAARTQRR